MKELRRRVEDMKMAFHKI